MRLAIREYEMKYYSKECTHLGKLFISTLKNDVEFKNRPPDYLALTICIRIDFNEQLKTVAAFTKVVCTVQFLLKNIGLIQYINVKKIWSSPVRLKF